MDLLASGLTALVALLSVGLGSLLSFRIQEKHWHRDHTRHWRDIRLSSFASFLAAFRSYVAFALEPGTTVEAVPDPYDTDRLMPIFASGGTAYKEKLEAAKTQVRLVALSQTTLDALDVVVQQARRLAASRANCAVHDIPAEVFGELWKSEHAFLLAAREELSLPSAVFPRPRVAA